MGKKMKQLFVLIVLIGLIITLTPAVQAAVLWVVPEDSPTWYTGPNEDFLLDQIVRVDTNMDSTFSGTVIVLNQASPQDADAEEVYLKFFVPIDTTIDPTLTTITIKTVTRIQPGLPDEPNDAVIPPEPPNFVYVSENPPVPEGYGVAILIGTIPFSGGPNQTGNIDDGTFNPANADCYIEVPFTINFDEPPELGFTLYVYAENELTGKDRAKTAYSHDGGYTHVPEFASIAIPVAAILGLFFLFNRRKRRKE